LTDIATARSRPYHRNGLRALGKAGKEKGMKAEFFEHFKIKSILHRTGQEIEKSLEGNQDFQKVN